MLATLLEIVGFLLVISAAYLVSLPLALLVAGVGLLVAAGTLSAPGKEARTARRKAHTS